MHLDSRNDDREDLRAPGRHRPGPPHGQDNLADAGALLAPVLAHFTEGTDSPPVSEARALLADL